MKTNFYTAFCSLALLSLLLVARPAAADGLMMIRVQSAFPEAMASLQDAINHQGYTISRVQRVDVGLTKSGYKTAAYRVVFFGKPKEMAELPVKYPDLTPYLPLKITIFAERNESLLLTLDPMTLADFYPHKPGLRKYLERWKKDVRMIFDRMREGD